MTAATVDLTKSVAASKYQSYESQALVKRVRTIDFAEAVTAKGSALVNTNTIDAVKIDIGDIVIGVYVRQITSGTASSTVTVGYDGSATAFIASVSTDAAAGTVGAATLGATYFAAASAVRLTCGNTAPQTGIVEVTTLSLQTKASATV